jgi:hypothetical protein
MPVCPLHISHGLTQDYTQASAVMEWRLTAFDVYNECTLFTKLPLVRHREKDACTTKKNQLMLCRKVIYVHYGNHSKHKIHRAEEGQRIYSWAWRYVLTTRLWMVKHHFNFYLWASDTIKVIPCGICGRPSGIGTCFLSEYFVLHLLVSFHQYPTHSFITETVRS